MQLRELVYLRWQMRIQRQGYDSIACIWPVLTVHNQREIGGYAVDVEVVRTGPYCFVRLDDTFSMKIAATLGEQ